LTAAVTFDINFQMNLIKIDKVPKSIVGFVESPNNVITAEQEVVWLRMMLNQGAINIHLPNSYLETVQAVYDLAISKNYKISFTPLSDGSTASAEFWLQVTP
jgi:hypothetical protein